MLLRGGRHSHAGEQLTPIGVISRRYNRGLHRLNPFDFLCSSRCVARLETFLSAKKDRTCLNMKMPLSKFASCYALVTALLISGCGGGGGGGNDGPAGGAAASPKAPASLSSQGLRIIHASGPDQRLDFSTEGNEFSQTDSSSGVLVRRGTYAYSPSEANANLSLMTAGTSEVTTLSLTFTAANSGNFRSSSSNGEISSGTFTLIAGAYTPPPAGGNNPGPTDPGQGNNGGGNNGNTGNVPPVGQGGLDGRVMTLTRSTGQTHTYTFQGNQFVDSDPPEEGRGTYTFSKSGSQGSLSLHYTGAVGPVNLTGDRHDIQLAFTTDTSGTYTSTYVTNEGATLSQDGTFQFIQ